MPGIAIGNDSRDSMREWVDFSGMPCPRHCFEFEPASPPVPAQIPPSVRCPAGCDQPPLHSSVAFCLRHLSDTFHFLPYIVFVFIR